MQDNKFPFYNISKFKLEFVLLTRKIILTDISGLSENAGKEKEYNRYKDNALGNILTSIGTERRPV